jgi:hypothetical protein
LQPPSADTLYDRITDRITNEGDSGVIASEEDIEIFLRHHPRDRRSAELQRMQEQIDLLRLERTLERQARRRSGQEGLSLIELHYLEAMNAKATDPATAHARFQALVQMFEGGGHTLGKQDTLCLKLARRQAVQLSAAAQQHVRDNLLLIQKRLARAAELDDSDPEAAANIRLGIIQWYGDKPWARDGLTAAWQGTFAAPAATAAQGLGGCRALAARLTMRVVDQAWRETLVPPLP